MHHGRLHGVLDDVDLNTAKRRVVGRCTGLALDFSALLTGFNVLASGLVRLLDVGMDFPKTIVDKRMRDNGSDKAVRRSRAAYCSLVSCFCGRRPWKCQKTARLFRMVIGV